MRALALAASAAVLLALVGYAAVASSSYVDVGELAEYRRPTAVTVRARLVDTEIEPERDLLVFVLGDDEGNAVRAVYNLTKFLGQYGAPPSHRTVDQEIVIRGVFYPAGEGEGVLGEIEIEQILQGCHRAYDAPPATGG